MLSENFNVTQRTVPCVILAVLLVLFSGCQNKNRKSGSESLEAPNLEAVVSDIGKTLDDLRLQHPSYEYLHLAGYDFSAECLGIPDGTFAYVFFGTQAGPGIEEMASRYGKELKCAGIYTTVDQVFSITSEGSVSVEDFLLSIGINSKDSNRVNFWFGWVLFDYENYSLAINTNGTGNADSGAYDIPKTRIEKGFPLIIKDEKLWSSNEQIAHST